MLIYNKTMNFFINRGCSDDLFIKLCDNNLNNLSGWLGFKTKYSEIDLKKVIKLVKKGLKARNLYKYLEVSK